MPASNDQQFFGNLPPYSSDFAAAVMARNEDHEKRLRGSRRHTRMRRSWMKYYSRAADSGVDETEINVSGEQGEITHLRPNRYRRLIQDQLALIMQTPPDYEPQAVNTDPESQAQCSLALGILDQYKRTAHLEDIGVERAEVAFVLGESFLHVRWDPEAGAQKEIAAASGNGTEKIPQGDFTLSVRTPYEVAYEPTAADRRKPGWWIVREPMNRWDLLAQYGTSEDLRAAILGAAKWSSYARQWDFEQTEAEHDDMIAVYWVYVARSKTCPDGRMAIVLDSRNVLLDVALADERPGVFRYAPSEVIFKPEGYTNNFDGMPIQEALHAQHSTILTNQTAFGVQRLINARGNNVQHNALATGLATIDYDAFDPVTGQPNPEPHVAQLLSTPAEVLTMLRLWNAELDTVMGGSPVSRGDPEATKGDSGSKAAMLFAAAQAIGSGAVRAKLRSDEEVATYIISSLRRHATEKRITSIVGKNNTYSAREYIGEDLSQISRVNVRQPNPSRDTFAGRMQLAEMLLPLPPEQREQMQSFVVTGRLEPMMQDVEASRLLIERENEWLRDGSRPVRVMPGDQHAEHIKKHLACCNDPVLRYDDEAMRRHHEHIAMHVAALTPGAPGFAGMPILAATGQKPFPPAGTPDTTAAPNVGGPSQHTGAPQQPQMRGSGTPNTPENVAATGARMPQQPKNPATGERVNLPVPEAPQVGPVQ